MFQRIRSIKSLIAFMFSQSARPYLRVFYYVFMANFIAGIHLMLIFGNTVALALLIGTQPCFIWLPIASLLVSPFLGGSHCFLNRLENHYRMKACMPLISDRLEEFLTRSH